MPVFPRTAGKTPVYDWPGRRMALRLNKRDDSTRLGKNEFDILRNMLTRGGALQRRPGYTPLLAAAIPAPVTSLAWYQKADDTTRWLAFAGATAYSLAGAPGSGVATDTVGGFANTKRKRARQYGDKLYVVQGEVGVREYNGAAWSATAAKTGVSDNDFGTSTFNTVAYIASSFDRVFYTGSALQPQYVWVSEIGEPNYCKTGMVVKIDSQDGQDNTGLLEWGNYILVMKERSIWAIPAKSPADTTFRVFRVTASVGCPSGDALAQWGNYAFFLGSDKRVYMMYLGQIQDDIRAVAISDLIQPHLDPLTAAQMKAAEAVVFDDYFILAAGGKWFVLDLQESGLADGAKGAVWVGPWDHAAAQTALMVHPTTYSLYGADGTGQIHLHWHNGTTDLTTDGGTNIQFEARRGWEDDGRQELYKLWPQFFAWTQAITENSEIQMVLDVDQNVGQTVYDLSMRGDGFVLGTSQLGVDGLGYEGEKIHEVVPPTTGRRIRVTFRNKIGSNPSTVKIFGYNRYYRYLSA